MTMNVLTKPKEAFKTALEDPNPLGAIAIVLISSLIFSGIVYLLTNNIVATTAFFVLLFVQWFVFSAIYWAFEFIFKPKKGFSGINFLGVISATGKLWILTIIFSLLLLVALIGGIVAAIMGILSMILGLLFVIYSFILMKVLLDADNLRTFFAWIIALILHFLLLALASGITQMTLLMF